MQALAAGGLREALQLQGRQPAPHIVRGVDHALPRHVVAGIEIDGDAVGQFRTVGLGAPRMDFQHARLNQLEQACEIVDHQHRLLVVGHRHLAHAVAQPRPGVLLEEALFVDAFGMAQEAERPADQVRQDPVGDLAVELGKPLLGDALVGPQQATGIGEPHRQLPGSFAIGRLASGLRLWARLRAAGRFGDLAFDELAEHRVAYQPAAGAAAILDLGRQHRLDPAHALGRRRLVLQRRRAGAQGIEPLPQLARGAAVKPEPQWPTGISRLPAYSPSTSAPDAPWDRPSRARSPRSRSCRSGSTSP